MDDRGCWPESIAEVLRVLGFPSSTRIGSPLYNKNRWMPDLVGVRFSTKKDSRMTPKRKHTLEAKAEVFKALAHPTRILFVEELAKGEQCVCELTALVDADISTVSKHLSILRRAGIVNDEKRGNMVFYSLAAPCVLKFLLCVEGMVEARHRDLVALHG